MCRSTVCLCILTFCLISSLPALAQVEAETLSFPNCQATLEASEAPWRGKKSFASIQAKPSLSVYGCSFISFYEVSERIADERRTHIIARYWKHTRDADQKPALLADSRSCRPMRGTLRALSRVRPPEYDFPVQDKAHKGGGISSVMMDGTTLTFTSWSHKRSGTLISGYRSSTFTTLDFPKSPISKWLTKELPKLEACWQPEENGEEYPIEIT